MKRDNYFYNHARMTGVIEKITHIRTEDGPSALVILKVTRRIIVRMGNKSRTMDDGYVYLWIKKPYLMDYFEKKDGESEADKEAKMGMGDLIEAEGILKNVVRNLTCNECGDYAGFDTIDSYVEATSIVVLNHRGENTVEEYCVITKEEKESFDKSMKRLRAHIDKIRKTPGALLDMRPIGKDAEENTTFKLQINRTRDPRETRKLLKEHNESSNEVHVMAVITEPPVLKQSVRFKECFYNARILGDMDDEEDVYVYVHSVGENAEKDYVALREGSEVIINGSLHAVEMKNAECECVNCGNKIGYRTDQYEIRPYYVEFIANYNKLDPEKRTLERLGLIAKE